jgi:hypothetical protein
MLDDFEGGEQLEGLLPYNQRQYNFVLVWRRAMLPCVDDDMLPWVN